MHFLILIDAPTIFQSYLHFDNKPKAKCDIPVRVTQFNS